MMRSDRQRWVEDIFLQLRFERDLFRSGFDGYGRIRSKEEQVLWNEAAEELDKAIARLKGRWSGTVTDLKE